MIRKLSLTLSVLFVMGTGLAAKPVNFAQVDCSKLSASPAFYEQCYQQQQAEKHKQLEKAFAEPKGTTDKAKATSKTPAKTTLSPASKPSTEKTSAPSVSMPQTTPATVAPSTPPAKTKTTTVNPYQPAPIVPTTRPSSQSTPTTKTAPITATKTTPDSDNIFIPSSKTTSSSSPKSDQINTKKNTGKESASKTPTKNHLNIFMPRTTVPR